MGRSLAGYNPRGSQKSQTKKPQEKESVENGEPFRVMSHQASVI